VKPAPFAYHAPDTVEEAVALLSELGDEAKVLAGGQSLIPMLALRLAVFGHLVDVGRVSGLAGIAGSGDAVHVGAATTEAAVEASPEIAARVPLLARATPLIGHFQIRNRGTVGGSVAHADPAAEYPAVALALDATMHAASVRGPRSIPAADFFDGLWSTTLADDELLTGVSWPVWNGRCGFSVQEFARRQGDFALAGATVAVELDRADRVVRSGIGLIGLGPTPLRAGAAEAAVRDRSAAELEPAEVGRAAVAGLDGVPSDLHGSARYRVRVGAEMVARAWRAAVQEARGGD
jgi:aerobic carbon-monoxide dehydrogenase medium subunit